MFGKQRIDLFGRNERHSVPNVVGEFADIRSYSATAARLWLDPSGFRSALEVGGSRVLDLTSERDAISAIAPVWRRTERVDTFKAWVGVSDEDAVADYWPLPENPWSGRPFRGAADLSTAEHEAIETAGRAYIFGNSSAVANYRGAIERVTGTFEVAVYAAQSVRIASGATLHVTGAPAVLLFEHLEIAEGGQLIVQTVCRAAIGRLTKTDAVARR